MKYPLLMALPMVTLACASGPRSSPESPAGSPDELFEPRRILEILEASKVAYDIDADSRIDGLDITELVTAPVVARGPMDPFLRVEPGKRLRSDPPPEEIAAVFRHAGEAFFQGDYELAKTLYREAIRRRPDYFKSYTYLGNTEFFLERFAAAEAHLLKALELNPFDYQAYLFLGDAYHQVGEYEQAKRAFLRAFLLNRGSDAVRSRLSTVLARLGLRIRADRLAPEFRIERLGQNRVALRFDRDEGLRWLPLAACMACWAYEDRCRERRPPEKDPFQLFMYRECLINQYASIAVRRQETGAVPTDEAALQRAMDAGFLDAILFWEIAARRDPKLIMLLPPAALAHILSYIEEYVLAPVRVI